MAEAHRRDLAGGNRELHVPIVFVADIKKYRVGDLPRQRRARQELPEMLDIADKDADAELVADAVHARARDAILAEPAIRLADARALAGSSSSQAPTNSSISTRVSRKLERKERSREALLTRAASSPAYCSLAKSEIESASRNAGVPMPIIEPI